MSENFQIKALYFYELCLSCYVQFFVRGVCKTIDKIRFEPRVENSTSRNY